MRGYTHVFGSVSPQDGERIRLILPPADTSALSFYLAAVSRRHPQKHLLMFMDRAGWHQAKALVVPDNITVNGLPPYSPQGNPQELVWREVRRHPFGNHDYVSMDTVETALERRLAQLESSPAQIQSPAGFDWIIASRHRKQWRLCGIWQKCSLGQSNAVSAQPSERELSQLAAASSAETGS